MRRIAIVGSSGAGKSWLGKRLGDALGLEYVELDAIHHGPGWVPLPAEQMRRLLDRRCAVDGAWIVDGNYAQKGGELIRERADTIVWIDLPRYVVMGQLTRRTLGRLLRRQELWNGNRESLRNALSPDPERSVLVWSFTRHHQQRDRYAAEADGRWVRLTSRGQVNAFLAAATGRCRGQ